jgi:hypothetical protein
MARVRYVDVAEPEQMQMEITRLISAGFTVSGQNNRSVTLVRRKNFSIATLIIGLLLGFLPALVYLTLYACQSDQIAEVRLIPRPEVYRFRRSDTNPVGADIRDEPPPQAAPILQLSPDRQQWWDGLQWLSTATSCPPHALRRPDGGAWWDGLAWRPMPALGSGEQPANR